MDTDFTWHLRKTAEGVDAFLDAYRTLEKEVKQLRNRNRVLENLLIVFPVAADVQGLIERLERGIPLYSSSEITDVQHKLLDHLRNGRQRIDDTIADIENQIKAK